MRGKYESSTDRQYYLPHQSEPHPLPDKKPVKYCNEDDRSLILYWDRHTNLAGLNRLIWQQWSCWTHCLVYSYFLGFLYHWWCVHFNCMRLLHEMTIQSHLSWRAVLYKGSCMTLAGFGHHAWVNWLYCSQRLELIFTVSVHVVVYYGEA
jgi:hypothetical protein